eukprot:363428-Chlamydomonas_euryale.AAC.12
MECFAGMVSSITRWTWAVPCIQEAEWTWAASGHGQYRAYRRQSGHRQQVDMGSTVHTGGRVDTGSKWTWAVPCIQAAEWTWAASGHGKYRAYRRQSGHGQQVDMGCRKQTWHDEQTKHGRERADVWELGVKAQQRMLLHCPCRVAAAPRPQLVMAACVASCPAAWAWSKAAGGACGRRGYHGCSCSSWAPRLHAAATL